MPRPARTEEQIGAMQERILDIAHELIHEGGPRAVSIRRIAAELGISHMTFYNYFPSREVMLEKLRERELARVAECQEEMSARARSGPALPVILENLTGVARRTVRRPEMYRLAFTMANTNTHPTCNPGPKNPLRHQAHLRELIQIGIEKGEFHIEDAEGAALLISALIQGPLGFFAAGYLEPAQLQSLWEETLRIISIYLTRGTSDYEIPLEDLALS